jgi:hypothetical protein
LSLKIPYKKRDINESGFACCRFPAIFEFEPIKKPKKNGGGKVLIRAPKADAKEMAGNGGDGMAFDGGWKPLLLLGLTL